MKTLLVGDGWFFSVVLSYFGGRQPLQILSKLAQTSRGASSQIFQSWRLPQLGPASNRRRVELQGGKQQRLPARPQVSGRLASFFGGPHRPPARSIAWLLDRLVINRVEISGKSLHNGVWQARFPVEIGRSNSDPDRVRLKGWVEKPAPRTR